MARRRLRNAVAGLGGGLQDIGQILIQNELIRRRQAQQTQDQQLKEMLDTFNTDVKGLMNPEEVAKVGPGVMGERYQALRRRMPKELEPLLGEAPDFAALDSTPQQRMAPIRKSIDTATTPEGVPSAQSILSQFVENRVTPSENFGDLTRMMGEARGRREDMLAGQPREAIKSINPEGVEQTQYLTEREQGDLGPLRTERSAGEQASREGTIRTANEQAQQDVLNNPKNQAGRARGAGMEASARRQAELKQEMAQMGLTAQQQSAALQLSDDFEKQSGNFYQVRDSLVQLQQLGATGSPMRDIALVFNFMKANDPGSTVREGEQAQARNAAGVPERIRNTYNRLLNGESLTPEQRADIIETAKQLYIAKKPDQDKLIQDFTSRAQQYRVPPSLVVREPKEPNLGTPANTPGAPGQPGSALQEILKRGEAMAAQGRGRQ